MAENSTGQLQESHQSGNGSSRQRIWTIRDLLAWTEDYFRRKGSEPPRLDAEVLLAHALGCRRIDLYLNYDKPIEEPERAVFRELVRRRGAHEPVAYLVGRKEFFSLEFEVTRDVLIPRPDSEFVVMTYLEHFRTQPFALVADVGTGSGNLAVTIAHEHRGARVIAVDRSQRALQVARRNAVRHAVEERVSFVQADLLSALRHAPVFDAIVSNPPYIPSGEIENLEPGVRDFEPREALDGGPSGLDVVKRLIDQAVPRLKRGGMLILEIGAPQEDAVRQLVAKVGAFELLPTVFDYAGHPRVVAARKAGS